MLIIVTIFIMADNFYDTTSSPSYTYNGSSAPSPEPTPTPTPNVESASATLLSSASAVDEGDTLSVDIKVNSNGTDVGAVSLKIEFDPDVLKAKDSDSTENGDQVEILDNDLSVLVNSVDNVNGEIYLELNSPTAASLNDAIASIKFEAISSGSTSISISEASSEILNGDSEDILTSVQGVNLSINANETPTPTTPADDNDSSLPESGILGSTPTTLLFGGLLIVLSTAIIIRSKFKNDPQKN